MYGTVHRTVLYGTVYRTVIRGPNLYTWGLKLVEQSYCVRSYTYTNFRPRGLRTRRYIKHSSNFEQGWLSHSLHALAGTLPLHTRCEWTPIGSAMDRTHPAAHRRRDTSQQRTLRQRAVVGYLFDASLVDFFVDVFVECARDDTSGTDSTCCGGRGAHLLPPRARGPRQEGEPTERTRMELTRR